MNIGASDQKKPIYLDGFASLPLAQEARDAMLSVWDNPGNAGSPNAPGERAAHVIANARFAIGDLIGAAPGEIVFTSGATEANNLAMLGATRSLRRVEPHRRRILISAIEHKSVIEPARHLEADGLVVDVVPVTSSGVIDLAALSKMAGPDLLLASVMLVNNELGTVQPVKEACEIIHAVGGLFHSDAAQAVGKLYVDVADLDVDFLSLSAHKCYGPMGVGALYIAAGTPKPDAQSFGGGQQGGIRPGTEPVPLIAGFGAAAHAAKSALAEIKSHSHELLAVLLDELERGQLRFSIVSNNAERVPGGVALAILDTDGDALCAHLASDVAISTGSACTSGQIRTSHVLEAIGFTQQSARSVIRIFCSHYNTLDEVRTAARQIVAAARRCRLATGEVHQ